MCKYAPLTQILRLFPQMEPNPSFFKYKHYDFWKIEIFAKTELLINENLQNNFFLHLIVFMIKITGLDKVWTKSVRPASFALALGPHCVNNIYTYVTLTFFTPLFGIKGVLNGYFR